MRLLLSSATGMAHELPKHDVHNGWASSCTCTTRTALAISALTSRLVTKTLHTLMQAYQ